MVIPCANSNIDGPLDIAKVDAEEFARLTHHGNEAFALLHIQQFNDAK